MCFFCNENKKKYDAELIESDGWMRNHEFKLEMEVYLHNSSMN